MDTEIGLYYLVTRYYDPVTYRFINADGYFQTGQGFLDKNMGAYCLNNPVMRYDPTGTCSSFLCAGRGVCKDFLSFPKYNPMKNPFQSIGYITQYPGSSTTSGRAYISSRSGKPNSKETIYNDDGTPKQDRWRGDNRMPIRDRDYNHPGNMPFPHDHEWIDGKRQKEHLPPDPSFKSQWDYDAKERYKKYNRYNDDYLNGFDARDDALVGGIGGSGALVGGIGGSGALLGGVGSAAFW